MSLSRVTSLLWKQATKRGICGVTEKVTGRHTAAFSSTSVSVLSSIFMLGREKFNVDLG
jgi:hypothetical protein